jgi:hypothetical protein
MPMIPDAPPATMPSAAVGGSSPTVRTSTQPQRRLRASVAALTIATGSHAPATALREDDWT